MAQMLTWETRYWIQIMLATWEMLDPLWELCRPIKHTVGTWVLPVQVPSRGAYGIGSLQEQSRHLNQCSIPRNVLQSKILVWGFNSYAPENRIVSS